MEINSNILQVADIYQKKYGTSDTFKKYMVAQMVHESANGTSRLATEDNNFGGLTGYHKSAGGQPDGDGEYGHFDTLEEYATYLHDGFFQHYEDIHNATTAGEYARILKQNGYYTDDENSYASSLASISGEEYTPQYITPAGSAGMFDSYNFLAQGVHLAQFLLADDMPFEAPTTANPQGFWSKAEDSFLNEWYNNGTVSLMRMSAIQGSNRGMDIDWKPRQVDLDTINTYFKGDLETQHFILSNAHNQNQFYALLQQKREDKAREERVEKAGYGLKSLGGLAGILADPLNFVPFVGQEALIAKAMTRLGTKTLANIGLSKAFQIAELGATNGLINMADQKLAQEYGGYTPDYTTAFLFGSAIGAGAGYLHRMRGEHKSIVGETPETDKLARQVEAEGEQAIMQSADLGHHKVATEEVPKMTEKDFVQSKGYSNKGEWAEHLLHHKRSKEWESAKEFYGLSNSELKTKLKDYASLKDYFGRLEKTYNYTREPIVKHEDGSVTINDVTLSEQSVVAKLINEEENHFFDGLDPDEELFEGTIEPHTVKSEEFQGVDEEIPLTPEGQPKEAPMEVEPAPKQDIKKLYGESGVTNPEEVLKEAQGGTGAVAKAKQFLETTKYFGTTFGHFLNSPSNTLRHFAKTYLLDPRDRGVNQGLNIELAKQIAQKDYKIAIAKLDNDFKQWYWQHPDKKWSTPMRMAKDFNAELVSAFHQKYRDGKSIDHYSKATQDAVEHLKEFRDLDLREAKRHGFTSEDFDGSNELWRRVDKSKLNLMREDFVSEEAQKNFLRKYIELAIDRDKLEEGVDIRTEAEEYAKYIMNTGNHNFEDGVFKDVKGDKRLAYWKKRLPMDTSRTVPINIVGGATDKALNKVFSFDANLRDTNVVNHMHYVANRSSGAIALKQNLDIDSIGGWANAIDLRVKDELKQAIDNGWISQKEAKQQLLDVHRAIHHLTGARIFEDVLPSPETAMSRVRDIALDASYAMNGMNFGLSAIAEHAGAVSKVGSRALGHFIPALNDALDHLKGTKYLTPEQKKAFKRMEIGTYMSDSIWFDPRVIDRDYLENYIAGAHMEALGATQDGLGIATRITSTLSQVQQITNHSIQSIIADLVPDTIAWANDDFSSVFRKNLFNEDKFKRVGIDDIDEFKAEVKHYLSDLDNADELALHKRLREWQDNNNLGYTKFLAFLDRHSKDVILQPHFSAGNTRITGFIVPVLMQFKAFSRMALNSHLMRGLEHWERENIIQTLATAVSGGMLWAIRQRAQAEYQYGDNEKAKQKFLDKQFTLENILRAGITRSSILSATSFGDDAYQLITGRGSTTRTTVDRPEWTEDGGFVDGVADRAKQFAVLGSAMRVWNGAESMLEGIGVLEENKTMRKGNNALTSIYPINRYLPMQIFLTGMSELADKEIKDTNRVRQEQQRLDLNREPKARPEAPKAKQQTQPKAQPKGQTIEQLIRDPKKKQELIDGINQEKPKALKGRKAEELSDDELVNLYNEYRRTKGQ